MTVNEAIKWIDNLANEIGQPQYQRLWGYHQALDEIKDILKQTTWTPCSERLPEEGARVLVTTAWGDVAIADKLPNKRWWHEGYDWWIHEGDIDAEKDDVIAWMLRPEPYKGEQNDGQVD